MTSTWTKRGLATALVVVVAAGILHLINLIQVGAPLWEGAQPAIERSRRVRDRAGPRYQPEVLQAMAPNPLVGEVYRLDDLLGSSTVVNEPQAADAGDDAGILFAYEFDDPREPGLKPANGISECSIEDGVLTVEASAEDYLINAGPLEILKDPIADIVIRARATAGTRFRIAWNRMEAPGNIWKSKLDSDLIADSEFRTYVINGKNALRRGMRPGDHIRALAVNPSDVEGAVVEIDFIRFISKRAKYATRPRGVDYEVLGGETRPVLYMLTPQTLQYSVRIPERSPALDVGTAVLLDGDPVEFEIELDDGEKRQSLHSETLSSTERWSDARIDLSRWSGEEVDLFLSVRGRGRNVALWSSPVVFEQHERRLNVIVLLEDALRADHLSLHGYERPTSPQRDRLLEESGVAFMHAFSQAAKTRPSVPSLMTSLYPTATGVLGFADMLEDEYVTLAEVLRSQGFVTASFVQNGNAGPFAGLHQGFDRLIDYGTITQDTAGMFGEPLLAWLERHRHRNFFLYLHLLDPHAEYDPPEPFDRWYREQGPGTRPVEPNSGLDPDWLDSPTLESRSLLYDGEISRNDSFLPRFLDMLDDLDLRRDTVVILTSDHGEFLGEHGLWEHRPPGYRQGIHVPLQLVYPARYDSPLRISAPVQLIDVMPTILELAEVDSGGLAMHGESLVDLIEGRRAAYWHNRMVMSEEPMAMDKGDPFLCGSLFFRNWHVISSKYIGNTRIPAVLRTRVYDYVAEPDESRRSYRFVPDLITRWQYRRIVTELQRNNLSAWKSWTGGEADTLTVDPDVREHLEALGYIQ